VMKAYVGKSSFEGKPAYVILNNEIGGYFFVTTKTAEGVKAFVFDGITDIIDSRQLKESYSDQEISYAVISATSNAIRDYLVDEPNPVRSEPYVPDNS
jgi:hypothetical protein